MGRSTGNALGAACELTLGGERLLLLAERAVLWPDRRAVLVADVHLGKAASYRGSGMPVPEAVTTRDLGRLSGVIEGAPFAVDELIVLGDLVHSSAWERPACADAVRGWLDRHAGLRARCVLGNHDLRSRSIPEGVEPLDSPWPADGLTLLHDPAEASREHTNAPALAGHLHPGVRLRGRRRGRGGVGSLRAACFWLQGRTLVLPAFSAFTGCSMVKPEGHDRVWVVSDDQIAEVPHVSLSR